MVIEFAFGMLGYINPYVVAGYAIILPIASAVSIIVMLPATTPLAWALRTGVTLIPIILLLTEKKYAAAAAFTVLYASAAVLTLMFISSGSTGLHPDTRYVFLIQAAEKKPFGQDRFR